MSIESNSISVLRKHVYNNVPGFDDDEEITLNIQNDWVKTYDFTCVDFAWANTVQNYDLEHDPNYLNNGNKMGANFYVTSTNQSVVPPYDIHTGDFIAYWQHSTLFIWRIVKINQSQMFKNCAVYELICDMFQPKEKDVELEIGVLEIVEVKDGYIVDRKEES